MELGADIPLLIGYLDNLYEVGGRIEAHTLHAVIFKRLLIGIIELVTMAMALADLRHLAISLPATAALNQLALIGAQSHRTAHLCDGLLLLHHVDDIMGRLSIHLTTVGILIAQHVAGELDDHHLHAQTDAEGRDIVGAGIFGCDNLSLDAARAKARTDDDTRHPVELRSHIVFITKCNRIFTSL